MDKLGPPAKAIARVYHVLPTVSTHFDSDVAADQIDPVFKYVEGRTMYST